jgi:hypothetical protein
MRSRSRRRCRCAGCGYQDAWMQEARRRYGCAVGGDGGAKAQGAATKVWMRKRRQQNRCGRTYHIFGFVSTKHYAGGAEGRRGRKYKSVFVFDFFSFVVQNGPYLNEKAFSFSFCFSFVVQNGPKTPIFACKSNTTVSKPNNHMIIALETSSHTSKDHKENS